jgi:hypothetical protein
MPRDLDEVCASILPMAVQRQKRKLGRKIPLLDPGQKVKSRAGTMLARGATNASASFLLSFAPLEQQARVVGKGRGD